MPTFTAARRGFIGLAASLTAPAAALAAPLTPALVFEDAALPVRAVILGLILATLAAGVICAIKLASGSRLAGGSAFLSGLRLGGPLAGLVGAAYGGLLMAIYTANNPTPASAQVIARGVAEAMMVILLGLTCGAVAVIANWAVEARIDRAVLGD
jgi:hypothetical protein